MAGPYEFRGTYVHLDLIPHIACWISASFALKVSKIVNEYRIKEANSKLQQKDQEIEQKDNQIEELKAMMQAILKDTGNLLKRNDNLEAKVIDLTDEISKLSLDNEITHEMLDNVQNDLETIIEDRVVRPKDESMLNTVVIYESKDQGENKFYIFRVQKCRLKAALKTLLLIKNPNAEKFDEIEYNPNAVNYYTRFKQEYRKDIKSYYNSFELINITKDQLREFIAKVNEEKYEIENCK